MMSTGRKWLGWVPTLAVLAACSSTKTNDTTDAGPAGGPVPGAQDTHCTADGGVTVQPVSASSCHPAPIDAGADGGSGVVEYGPTMFDSEADDDDCKYHVKWTASPVRQATDVSFTVTVSTKSDGQPATGMPVRAEVYLNDTHPAPNSHQVSTETATPGTYAVGPIRFDASGQWTVRFHFHEDCEDTRDDSPHGHAAFFVQVP